MDCMEFFTKQEELVIPISQIKVDGKLKEDMVL